MYRTSHIVLGAFVATVIAIGLAQAQAVGSISIENPFSRVVIPAQKMKSL